MIVHSSLPLTLVQKEQASTAYLNPPNPRSLLSRLHSAIMFLEYLQVMVDEFVKLFLAGNSACGFSVVHHPGDPIKNKNKNKDSANFICVKEKSRHLICYSFVKTFIVDYFNFRIFRKMQRHNWTYIKIKIVNKVSLITV